jgi:hypothetical protein
MSNNVRTHGYFFKPKRFHRQKKKFGKHCSILYYTTGDLHITLSTTLAPFTTFFYVNWGKFEHMKKLMNRAVELNAIIGKAVLVIMNWTGTLYE